MLSIGLPIIIHNLALVGMGLTDAIMAGLLGAKTLAGVAVGSSAWAPVFLFSPACPGLASGPGPVWSGDSCRSASVRRPGLRLPQAPPSRSSIGLCW